MKRISTLLFFATLLAAGSLQAQLAPGSIAPNFTVTDLDGNEWTLYDLTDQGYSVILDLSATWCGPCWDYHNSGILEQVWEQRGPNGTNEFMILMIEADPTTATSYLSGNGPAPSSGGTWGDWTVGVEYPIINDDNIADLYNINYYPTLYQVCPNRIVTEVSQVSATAHINFRNTCQFPEGANNVNVINYTGEEGLFCGTLNLGASFHFQNMGSETLTSASFELEIDGQVVGTKDWTGSLEVYEYEEITFDNVDITEDTEGIIRVTSANGGADDVTTNDDVEFGLEILLVEDQELTLRIRTDAWPTETYWYLMDDTGGIVAEGGNTALSIANAGTGVTPASGGYAANSINVESIIIPGDGCYRFGVIDAYGDGMCCSYGNGFYRLEDDDGNILFSGGDFLGMEEEPFEAALVVGVEELTSVEGLQLFPNPVSDRMTVNFGMNEANYLQVEVYNALGQRVQTVAAEQFGAGRHSLEVNAADLSNGVYFLRMRNNDRELNRRFVVNR